VDDRRPAAGGAGAFAQLLQGELGEAIRDAADTIGIADVDDHEAWERELLDRDALLLEFIRRDGTTEIGAEEPDHVDLEPVRRTQRPHKQTSWAQRAYRRWAADPIRHARSKIRDKTRIHPDRGA